MKKWQKIVFTCLLTILLLVFPPTRGVVLFILPLGSGIDDLIVIVLAALVLLVMFYKTITLGLISFAMWVLSFTETDPEVMGYINDLKQKLDK